MASGFNPIDARSPFESHVMALGWKAIRIDEEISISMGDAGLRLRTIPTGVCLEITHGPPGESQSWLELYSHPPDPERQSFVECIEYGLSLLGTPKPTSPSE